MSDETVNEEIDQSDDTNVYETSSRGQKYFIPVATIS